MVVQERTLRHPEADLGPKQPPVLEVSSQGLCEVRGGRYSPCPETDRDGSTRSDTYGEDVSRV